MSDDYKYDISCKADELAEERYGKTFYELTDEQQYAIFTEASQDYWSNRIDAAMARHDYEKEHRQ